MFVLTESWYAWYLGSADSESWHKFLKKFRQIWTKKVKKSALLENLHIRYLGYADQFSEFPTLNLFLGKFGSKNSKLPVLLENLHTEYLEDVDSYSDISFLNIQTYINFLGKFKSKKRIACFAWKLTHRVS